MRGFWAILLKEFAHLRRERTTLAFAALLERDEIDAATAAGKRTRAHATGAGSP